MTILPFHHTFRIRFPIVYFDLDHPFSICAAKPNKTSIQRRIISTLFRAHHPPDKWADYTMENNKFWNDKFEKSNPNKANQYEFIVIYCWLNRNMIRRFLPFVYLLLRDVSVTEIQGILEANSLKDLKLQSKLPEMRRWHFGPLGHWLPDFHGLVTLEKKRGFIRLDWLFFQEIPKFERSWVHNLLNWD